MTINNDSFNQAICLLTKQILKTMNATKLTLILFSLIFITFSCSSQNEESTRRYRSDDEPNTSKRFALSNFPGNAKDFNLKDFTAIEANGQFDIEIQQGPQYSITAKGPSTPFNRAKIYTSGNTLILDYNKEGSWYKGFEKSNRIGVTITVPQLDGIELTGTTKVYLRSFSADKMTIDLSGASNLEGDLEAEDIIMELNGAANATLRGKAVELKADMVGASSLNADEMIVETVSVDVGGASKAYVYGNVDLSLEASDASRIYYSGPGKTSLYRSGDSRIRKQ